MTSRRHVLGSGVLGGVASLFAPDGGEAVPDAAPPQLTERSLDGLERAIQTVRDETRTVARAIDSLRDVVRSERTFSELGPIRTVQKSYLRDRGKVPDFVEVGVDVWFNIYDWHIRWQQPMAFGRDGSGRYTLMVFQTTIIMRLDQLPTFVGDPYDRPA